MSVNTDVDPTSSPGDRSNQSPTQHNGGNNRLYARSLTKAIHNSKYPKTMLDLNEIKNFEKRIADLEKLPIDSELLKNRIAELPSREHSSKAYKDAGELEYFWTSNVKRRRIQTDHHDISASSSVDVKASVGQTIIDGFRVSMIDGQPAQKALEDGVKEEPSEINKKQLALSIKKLVKSMQDSTLESLFLKNKLTEAAKAKPYLLPIVNELEKQHVVFTSARDMILETQATLPTMSADDMEKAAGTLKTCSVHYEAFRNGALKEGSNLMK